MINIARKKTVPDLFSTEEELEPIKIHIDDNVEFMECDLDNIRQMLPKLYPEQQEDVLKAEIRFQKGKGMLFTNGTGTGKTLVGLGVAKRFYAQGKKNILIVVPTEAKCLDWIKEADLVDLSINMLRDTNDQGFEISVTTYANYYQNEAIDIRHPFDLIIYDESHYLNQNQAGVATAYLHKHKVVANVPSGAKEKALDMVGTRPTLPENYTNDQYDLWRDRLEVYDFRVKHHTVSFVEATKVLFLSATPFAYHKSIKYADGCLFDIEESLEEIQKNGGYNTPNGFNAFLCEHFGYRMRYNKCTIPETGVDQNLLERNFFENHVQKGVMSTKILELDYDYSREFILVNSKTGDFINTGIEMFYRKDIKKKYPILSEFADKKYRYLYLNQLLEAVKAKEINDRISSHLSLGRKVVVFHSYNNSIVEHPFHFDPYKMLKGDNTYYIRNMMKEIDIWNKEFPQYYNLDLNGMTNTREMITNNFPDAVQINGTISAKKRKQHRNDFNDNDSGVDLVLVQSKAGREGISLHDKIGNKQRVLINLSLPVAPTEAIQTEGRIYRSGLKSDAIYEYPVLLLNFEKIAFAEKIALRSKTAENLAMGNLARDLETAFKEGYVNAHDNDPHHFQGVGGKSKDRTLTVMSDYDKAKTYYFAKGKKTAKNKSAEGSDYFATPEPLGLKMVEWLDPIADEAGLEPSVGHGAIGRWFPESCRNTFIEPSINLFSEMSLNCSGRKENQTFEEFRINNKYDFIAMNPPFGKGGKIAMEHVQKAVLNHMHQYSRTGSRLVAIVPYGSSMDKRLEEFMEEKSFNNFRLTGELLLPEVVFQRAATSVRCKVIKIEHVNTNNDNFNQQDLSDCKDIGEFFDRLKEVRL